MRFDNPPTPRLRSWGFLFTTPQILSHALTTLLRPHTDQGNATKNSKCATLSDSSLPGSVVRSNVPCRERARPSAIRSPEARAMELNRNVPPPEKTREKGDDLHHSIFHGEKHVYLLYCRSVLAKHPAAQDALGHSKSNSPLALRPISWGLAPIARHCLRCAIPRAGAAGPFLKCNAPVGASPVPRSCAAPRGSRA